MSELRDLSNLSKGFDLDNYIRELSKFKNINIQDQDGNSLLHYCVSNCNYAALLYTMSKKANLNIQNNIKRTPLQLAVWMGLLPIAAALLQAGASPDVVDIKGRSPLYFAVKRNDIKCIRLLLDFGANPNEVVQDMSLLSLAAFLANDEAITLLIEAGARHDVGNIPPLISCIKSGSRPVLMALTEKNSKEILSVYNEKSILQHAIDRKTSLLPLIASMVRDEIEKMKEAGEPNVPAFPPENLTPAQQKRLQIAIERKDSVSFVSYTPPDEHQIRHLYHNLSAHQQESTVATEFQSQLGNDLDVAIIPTTQQKSAVIVEPGDEQKNEEEASVSGSKASKNSQMSQQSKNSQVSQKSQSKNSQMSQQSKNSQLSQKSQSKNSQLSQKSQSRKSNPVVEEEEEVIESKPVSSKRVPVLA